MILLYLTTLKILVMGAAGKTGNAIAFQLLAKGFPVRAFVRQDDDRADQLREAGAEIFLGNLAEMTDLNQAMKGIQRAYFVAPFDPGQLYKSMVSAIAAADAKLELVVGITQWLAQPQHPSVSTRESYMTNRILSWMPGVELVLVNPGKQLKLWVWNPDCKVSFVTMSKNTDRVVLKLAPQLMPYWKLEVMNQRILKLRFAIM